MITTQPYKVVILDDDNFHRQILEKICGVYPWIKTHSFSDPNEALSFITDQKVRIVLVDINMPSMYGDDVLRHCMALKQGVQVYVITGAENMALADRCLNIGARIIIRKPVTQKSIEEALLDARQHLERCRDTIDTFARKRAQA